MLGDEMKEKINPEKRKRKKILKPLAAIALSASLGFVGMLGLYKAGVIKLNPLELFSRKKPVQAQIVDDKKSYENEAKDAYYYQEAYDQSSFADAESDELMLNSGQLPILMYHKIGFEQDRFTVSPARFRSHLEKLYANDFQLISLEDYVNNDFSALAPGKKAAIITFDDADQGQFSYATYKAKLVHDEYGNPMVDPDCAVGILTEFAKEHSGFGKKAAFFIDFADPEHNYQAPFMQDELIRLKLLYLLKEGFEVCYHTYTHPDLSRCSLSRLRTEVLQSKAALEYYLGDKAGLAKNYLAYPYGAIPQDSGQGFYQRELRRNIRCLGRDGRRNLCRPARQ